MAVENYKYKHFFYFKGRYKLSVNEKLQFFYSNSIYLAQHTYEHNIGSVSEIVLEKLLNRKFGQS